MAHLIEYDAAVHEVHSVTVFQVNRAEVNRRITAQLKQGQNEVVICHLPTCLDQDSIRVDGIGKAVIFDVIYSPPQVETIPLESSFTDLLKKKKALESEQAILRRQSSILDEYARTLTGKDTTSEQLGLFLDTFLARKTALNVDLTLVEERLTSVEEEIKGEKSRLRTDAEAKKRKVKITVVVLSEEDGEAELLLTYVVTNASWKPLYDLRATIGSEGMGAKNGSNSCVKLHYRASIAQSTGEDWAGVNLTLSTASPQLGSEIPKLAPYWVGETLHFFEMEKRFKKAPAPIIVAPPPVTVVAPHSNASVTYPPTVFEAPPGAPQFFRQAEALATQGNVSATFVIEGLSTIPSDTDNASTTHKVSITELMLENVDLEWMCVPKEVPSAFLQCRVKNTSQYPLLPGQANVYMGNSFVSKSTIPDVSPQESFSCSLGVDGAIRVDYHPQIKKAKTVTGFITSKTSTTAFAQRITIKNTRRTKIDKLIVKDQVPLSNDAKIKVNILEPNGLDALASGGPNLTAKGGSGGGKKDVTVGQGITARWRQKNTEDNGDDRGPAGDGVIEWVCRVDSGATLDINLAYEVSAPVGVSWSKQ